MLLNYRDRGNRTGAFNIAYGRWQLSLVTLILNHQEVVPVKNHNMVKFRALLGEASRHKKGQTADLFAVYVLSISESAIRQSKDK
jgi:hypothetical protein